MTQATVQKPPIDTGIDNPDAPRYLVADLFCGAGGSSTGARQAIEEMGGEMNLVAINHWNTAIATHSANHPTARHLVEDVSIVDPEAIVPEGYLDLLMASPECKYHSRARGGKPIHDQGRMQAWAIFNWLTKLRVKCCIIENVPEFTNWGPLDQDDHPIREKRGMFFQAWFMAFASLGYDAQWRMLNAADFGDATSRTRFFLMARNDGRPIRWPEPTHARGDTGMFPGRKPWRGAREIIDWSLTGRSILDDPKYLARPLAEKTRQRIARGLEKFGGPLAPLYVRLLDLPGYQEPVPLLPGMTPVHPGGSDANRADSARNHAAGQEASEKRQPKNGGQPQDFVLSHQRKTQPRSTQEPVPTNTGRGPGYLVSPLATKLVGANRNHGLPRELENPIPSPTTNGGGAIFCVDANVNPLSDAMVGANREGNVPRDIDQPVPPATTAPGGGLFLAEAQGEPFVLGQHSTSIPRCTDQPIPTITTASKIRIVEPHLVLFYGQSKAQSVQTPLNAITKFNKHGLLSPVLVHYYSTGGNVSDVEHPLPSPTTRARHGLAEATLVEVNHASPNGDGDQNRRTPSLDEPLGVITQRRGLGLAEPVIVQTSHTRAPGDYSRDSDRPLPSLNTKADLTLVDPLLQTWDNQPDGDEPAQGADHPIPGDGTPSLALPDIHRTTLRQVREKGIDPRRLVFINDVPHLLDIRFRMLANAELAKAMGFDDEESTYEFAGNQSQVTKQIGNAVAVHLARALVTSALNP